MNDIDFKTTLIKAIRLDSTKFSEKDRMVRVLEKSNVFFEYTGIFTRIEWNTYCAILHIQVPVDDYEFTESHKDELLSLGDKIFGRQDDYLLTDISIGILIEESEVIDLSHISKTDIIKKALEDANQFMKEGKYASAIDRVHTAFHGYLRKCLDEKNVSYEESDTLAQLYSKLHNYIAQNIVGDTEGLIKTTLRSASGIVSAINDIRNKYSLVHPNQSLISDREAKLCIQLIRDVTSYIDEVI
jgi:HEPN domain-containing protein